MTKHLKHLVSVPLHFDSVDLIEGQRQQLNVGSVFFARHTFLVHPYEFYVLPSKNEKLVHFLQIPGRPFSKLDIKVNTVVVYRSREHNQFLRGVIAKIRTKEETCRILSIDYGFVAHKVHINDIYYTLTQKRAKIPAMAVRCELNPKLPREHMFNENGINSFKQFMGPPDKKLIVVVKKILPQKVEVTVKNSYGDDVATLLTVTEYAYMELLLPKMRSLLPARRTKKLYPWKHQTLSAGHTIRVTLQYCSSFPEIFISTLEDYSDYLQNRSDFSSYCKSQDEISELDFNVGAPIGVSLQNDSVYERAIIELILIPGYEAKVRLIDWGNDIIVSKCHVKLIKTEKFSLTPIRAVYCSIKNAKDWIGDLPRCTRVGYIFKMIILKEGHEFIEPYLVKLKSDEK